MTESQPVESVAPGTALTVIERAKTALASTAEVERELCALAKASETITVITNTDGYQQVHAARMALKNRRIELEKSGKEARDDATKFSKAVIAEESRLIAIIQPEEKRLQKIQDTYEAAIEAEKQRKAEAERTRVMALQNRVAELRGNQFITAAHAPDFIAKHLDEIEAIAIDDSFQEFKDQATTAKAEGIERLKALHAAAVARVEEEARIKAEREELARLRAEQQKREADERARLAEEERKAKAERDALAAKQAEELRLQREEQARKDEAARLTREAEEHAHQEKLRKEREEQEAAAALNNARMSEIQGIQHQVMIATVGRAGVRKGGTRECIVETLAETEAWEITEEYFGVLFESAKNVKANAIAAIRTQLDQFDQRAAQSAEQQRLAAERADLERQQAEARRVREEEERRKAEQARIAAMKKPGDAELIGVLTAYYGVPEAKVVEWLLAIDFSKLEAAA